MNEILKITVIEWNMQFQEWLSSNKKHANFVKKYWALFYGVPLMIYQH